MEPQRHPPNPEYHSSYLAIRKQGVQFCNDLFAMLRSNPEENGVEIGLDKDIDVHGDPWSDLHSLSDLDEGQLTVQFGGAGCTMIVIAEIGENEGIATEYEVYWNNDHTNISIIITGDDVRIHRIQQYPEDMKDDRYQQVEIVLSASKVLRPYISASYSYSEKSGERVGRDEGAYSRSGVEYIYDKGDPNDKRVPQFVDEIFNEIINSVKI